MWPVVVPLVAHIGTGSFELLQLLPLALAAGAYFRRARTLAARGKRVAPVRQAAFYAGLAIVLLSLASPIAHLGQELLLAHMAQHLLLADLGALFIVLGLTGPVLAPLLRRRAIARLRVLAHPLVALPLWAANLYLWHLPVLYQGSLVSEPLHALMHAAFLGLGVLVWMPLFGPLPKPEWFGSLPKLAYILGLRFTGTVLANVFLWSEAVFYPDYAPGRAIWDFAPLADQGVAGGIMLVEQSILTIALFGWLFLVAARETEERQALLEFARARGVELDERRARRAVAAGRAEELRERIATEAAQAPRHTTAAPVGR